MSQELLKRARSQRFFQQALLELAEELPQDDNALDQLISEAITARDNEAFVRIVFAAFGKGRRLDAKHLEDGSSLFERLDQFAAAALHCSGYVPGALIKAVQLDRLSDERAATALLLAAIWNKEHHSSELPSGLTGQARLLARKTGLHPMV